MNTFKPTPYAGNSPFGPHPGLTSQEAELAAVGVDDGVSDGVVAMMLWLDDGDDDMDSLRDELDMFRRENDFERD